VGHRRMDDVIKVSGYRLGTAEVESAWSVTAVSPKRRHWLAHELKGNAIHAYVILRPASKPVTRSPRSCATMWATR